MDVGSQVTVLYNAPYQMPFQLLIAQYFYFTGANSVSG